METGRKVLHDCCMAQRSNPVRQESDPRLGQDLEPTATEPTTMGKVVAYDPTVVGYGNVWNLVQENDNGFTTDGNDRTGVSPTG